MNNNKNQHGGRREGSGRPKGAKSNIDTIKMEIRLNNTEFIKQLNKVKREFEKLNDVKVTFSIEQEDEPIMRIIARRVKRLFGNK